MGFSTADFTADMQGLAFCTVVLFFKMWFCALYTASGRKLAGATAAPEDRMFLRSRDANSSVDRRFDTPMANNDLREPLSENRVSPNNSTQSKSDMSRLDRGQAMHRNDLENIPIFLVVAILLVMSSGSPNANLTTHLVYFSVFTVARIFHTLFYALSLQPWRTIAYFVGLGITIAACISLLIQVFTLPVL